MFFRFCNFFGYEASVGYLGSRILQLRGRSGGVISGKVGQGNTVVVVGGCVFPFAQTMRPLDGRESGKLPCSKVRRIAVGSVARIILSSELTT
ncbi:hypothetical protein IH785_08810 [candidate division KSB1 bacterium]|nr:hypothetical protein [candidate division KSB1 bacterium]